MPPPPRLYRVLRAAVRALVRVFYREVAVEGRAHVPADGGGLYVAWHPNGLIDPALILAASPRRVVFGARDGLLRWPILGRLFRALGTVPIYRPNDSTEMTDEARRAANAQSLGALADAVAGGDFSALFPEGVSHDQPHLAEIRSGAARLALLALERTPPGAPAPVVVPVGLHYEDKDVFRTDVLVVFHPPIPVTGDADALTDAIETALTETVRPTADWALHRLMHRVRSLAEAEAAARRGERPGPETVASRTAGFARVWAGYRVRRETHPDEIADLRRDLEAYDAGIRSLGVEDADLDLDPLVGPPVHVVGTLLSALLVGALLPPLLVLGAVANVPPYWALKGVTRAMARAEKDGATVKILGGLVLFPLAWTAVGVAAARGIEVGLDLPDAPVLAGVVVALLCAAGGVAVLLASEMAVGLARAVRVRFARRRWADRLPALRTMRAGLHDRFLALARERMA